MDLESRYPKCQAYPPVPNWYSSNVTAVMDPHFFLYATRNYIVMLDLKELRYFNSFTASFDKINAIATHGIFCFTAGVDKIVRVWNTLTNTLTTSYSEHKVNKLRKKKKKMQWVGKKLTKKESILGRNNSTSSVSRWTRHYFR